MSITVTLILELAALLGHAMLCITCVNWLHSTGWNRRLLDVLVDGLLGVLVFLPSVGLWWFFREGIVPFGTQPLEVLPTVAQIYFWFCTVFCLVGVTVWSVKRSRQRPPSQLLSTRTTSLDLREIGQPARGEANGLTSLLVRLPSNQMLRPNLVEYEVAIPRLPKELDGLVVTHFTDLHFGDHVSPAYFEEMIKLSNRYQPDFVMLTGDLLDRNEMIPRLAETFDQLEAKVGRYFVLGNHDRIFDHRRLRRSLSQVGLIDLGGCCESVMVRGQRIFIAGNEAPWFVPSGDFDACDVDEADRPLRVALSHSPDQIDWAVAKGVDLMLSGHLHGGQICLPWIGPIRSPSRYGFEYIGGIYYREPTLLCVSRGTSAQFPFRWNCPPELVKLILRSPF